MEIEVALAASVQISYDHSSTPILEVVFLPTLQDHWEIFGGPRLTSLASGRQVSMWSEVGRRGYRLCAKILDVELRPLFEIDAIPLPRRHFGFDVAALRDGGFAAAWVEKNLIKLRSYNEDGSCRKTTPVSLTTKPGGRVQLAVFPNGEIGIGYTDFLAIQTETGLLLCAVSPSAWHFTMTCQQNGRLVRVEMIDKHPSYHGGPPRYELRGSLINQAGMELGQFHLDVPATIVGDTYSHPDHLAISSLSGGGFVVVWTQLGHNLGNSIQARIFDETGTALGETIIVTAATASASVNEPSVIACNDGSFAVAWSENEDPMLVHRLQLFNNDGSRHGPTITCNDAISEGRSAIELARIASGQVVGRWVENGKIQTFFLKRVSFKHLGGLATLPSALFL